MTEEEIIALQNKVSELETALITERTEKEKAKADLNGVVDELKDLRQKKQELENKAPITQPDATNVEELVSNVLARKEQERQREAMEQAVAEFKASKQEFQADPAGLVFAKFNEGLKRFNFSDITSKEQMKERLEEVYNFYNQRKSEEETSGYDGTPSTQGNVPITQNEFVREVKPVLEMTGMKEEKYKELRSKYPDAFENLGLK